MTQEIQPAISLVSAQYSLVQVVGFYARMSKLLDLIQSTHPVSPQDFWWLGDSDLEESVGAGNLEAGEAPEKQNLQGLEK